MDINRIPAAASFEKCHRSPRLSVADWTKVFLFLFRAARSINQRAGLHYRREKWPRQQRATGFFQQQNQLNETETNAAILLRKNDSGVTLFGELSPEFRVVSGLRLDQPANFGHGTFPGEKLSRGVSQDFLAFG